jgi:hypothetical protein
MKSNMLNKDDELNIICQLDENKILGVISMDTVQKVIFDYVQAAPMYTALIQLLKTMPVESGKETTET